MNKTKFPSNSRRDFLRTSFRGLSGAALAMAAKELIAPNFLLAAPPATKPAAKGGEMLESIRTVKTGQFVFPAAPVLRNGRHDRPVEHLPHRRCEPSLSPGPADEYQREPGAARRHLG